MNAVLDAVSTYPTVIYTVLLGVALVYWLLAIVGGLDGSHQGGHDLPGGHHGDFHIPHQGGAHHGGGQQAPHHHNEVEELGRLASFVTAMGLNGIPFSVVFSLLVLFAWLFTGLVAQYLLPLEPTAVLRVLTGTAVLPIAFLAALPCTAVMVRPLRGMFVTHNARSNHSLVGESCTVVTLEVSESFGQAEVATRGASIQVPVRAATPNDFRKGSKARILEYDETHHHYLIGPDDFS